MQFYEQYGTDEWKNRRKEIIKIDKNQCRRCHSGKDLQVHHLHYVNGKDVWDYPDNELVTLCERCHQEIHHYKSYVNEALLSLMSDWCHDIKGVADYNDAWMILKQLSTMSHGVSKKYASICIQNAFIMDGDEDE